MTKDWVEAKIKEANDHIDKIDAEIHAILSACELLTEEDIKIILDDAAEHITIGLSSFLGRVPWKLFDKLKTQYEDKTEFFELYDKLTEIMESLPFKEKAEHYYAINAYKRYLDSDPVEFDGDIIITDPCYVMKEHDRSTAPKWDDYMCQKDYAGMTKQELEAAGYFEDYKKLKEAEDKWEEEHPDDWKVCEYGDRMDKLGFTPSSYMTRDTLYGDWSCTTFDLNTKEEIGGFCADAGLVSVFLLDDILRYNSDYSDHLKDNGCATLIQNFKGTVQFVVKEVTGEYDYDSEYHKKGDTWTDYQVEVVGHGINKITSKPIDFVGTQTGL